MKYLAAGRVKLRDCVEDPRVQQNQKQHLVWRVMGYGVGWELCVGFRVSSLGSAHQRVFDIFFRSRVSWFLVSGFEVSGFGVRVLGFGFREFRRSTHPREFDHGLGFQASRFRGFGFGGTYPREIDYGQAPPVRKRMEKASGFEVSGISDFLWEITYPQEFDHGLGFQVPDPGFRGSDFGWSVVGSRIPGFKASGFE